MTDLEPAKPEAAKKVQWPFHGYAPGGYTCKCATCDEEFYGTKGCITCSRCALERAYIAASAPPAPIQSLQVRVQPWMMACFGHEISADKLERGDRLVEEVFELMQSGDYPRERLRALEEYVWAREAGEPFQEVGGVMITLAAYCLAHDLDMHEAGEAELARIWTKVDKIRAKQAAKPVGSALPVAQRTRQFEGEVKCQS